MEKKGVSVGQLTCTMIMFLLASGLITGGNFAAKQDSWISMLLAIVLSIPLVMIYAHLSKLCPQQNLYDLLYSCFGHIAGGILSTIYLLYAIYLGTRVIRNSTEFIQVNSFPETPQWFIAVCIALISVWILGHGIRLLGRACVVILPVILLMTSLIFILSMQEMNLNYIRPVLTQDFTAIWKSAMTSFCFPLAETVLFVSVVPHLNAQKSPYKVYLTGVLVGGGMLLFIILRNILTIGIPVIERLFFPSYADVSVINIGSSFGGIEAVAAANMVVCLVVKTCICIYVAAKGLCKICPFAKERWLFIPIALFMIVASKQLYSETAHMFQFINSYIRYVPILQVVIPLLILVIVLVQRKKQQNGQYPP